MTNDNIGLTSAALAVGSVTPVFSAPVRYGLGSASTGAPDGIKKIAKALKYLRPSIGRRETKIEYDQYWSDESGEWKPTSHHLDQQSTENIVRDPVPYFEGVKTDWRVCVSVICTVY